MWKRNKENSPIYNSIKNNKILRNKFNQGGERSETLIKEIEDNTNKGKTSPGHGLEELILLKYPYYSKQSIDLMQSLSKDPWHFSQK